MQSERQKELFKEICDRLRATDETGRAKVEEWISQIRANLERNKAETAAAIDAPTLGEARKKLKAQIKQLEKRSQVLDIPEAFLNYGSTATDNPHDDPAIPQRAAEEQEASFRKHQAAEAATQELLADLRKRYENLNWQTRGGDLTTHTMRCGTPASNFAADCVKMFVAFRPGKCSWSPTSDLYVVAANIYERITGRSLLEKNRDFSLENQLKNAVTQFRRTPRQI